MIGWQAPDPALGNFNRRVTRIEFPPLESGFALSGLLIMLVTWPLIGAFSPLTFLLSAFLILNYQVEDKNILSLSLYIPLTVAAGTGMAALGQTYSWQRQSLLCDSTHVCPRLPKF